MSYVKARKNAGMRVCSGLNTREDAEEDADNLKCLGCILEYSDYELWDVWTCNRSLVSHEFS